MAKEQFVAMWRVLALCIFISWHLEWLVKWQGTEYHRKNVLIVFLCFVLTKKRDNWFFWKNETFRVFFLYFIHSPPPPVIMNIAWCSHHSIYIRTVRPWLLFSFCTFFFFNRRYSLLSFWLPQRILILSILRLCQSPIQYAVFL